MNSQPEVSQIVFRYLLIALGWICIILAILGIFLPLLPTTVFLLVAAWAFSRSSDRFHQWLVKHPKLGPIIQSWRTKAGIDRRVRNRAIFTLWATMVLSMLLIAEPWAVALLMVIGLAVNVYLMRLPVQDTSAKPRAIGSNNQPPAQ